MAEKRTIELEIQDNSKTLKQQYKEAVQELQKVSAQYGETSEQAIKAAKAAADLKDQIGFSKDLVDSFNPDAKFNALSRSVGGVLDGFQAFEGALGLIGVDASKLQETMVRLQSVMALSQGLQGLGEARDSFKQLGLVASNALKGIRTGLAATGIGLFVVALGTIVAYWDDIKAAVGGVSEEQKKLNKDAEKNALTAKETYDSFQLQENSLRLQGKSEKEILQLKLDKLNTSIKTAEVEVKRLEETSKLEIAAAERNQQIAKDIIRFGLESSVVVLRAVAAPFDLLIEGANKLAETLGFGKIAATNINTEITKLTTLGAEIGSKFLFDPAKVKAESDATIKTAKQGLAQMKSDRDGFLVQLKQGDQNSVNDQAKTEKEKLDLTRQRIDKEIELMADGYEKERRQLEESAKREKEDLAESIKGKIYDQEEYAKTQKLIDDNLKKDLKKLNSEYFDGELQARGFSIEALKNDKMKELEIEVETNQEKIKLNKETQEKLAADDLAAAQKRTDLALKYAQTFVNVYSSLNDLMSANDNERLKKMEKGSKEEEALKKKMFKRDKALRIVQTIMDTASNVVQSVRNGGGIPTGIPFGVAAATMGALQIAAISKTKFDAGTNEPPPAGGGGIGGGAPMTANFSTIGSSGINQLAQLQQMPTQAYVVSGEVTSAQALDRNRVQNATL